MFEVIATDHKNIVGGAARRHDLCFESSCRFRCWDRQGITLPIEALADEAGARRYEAHRAKFISYPRHERFVGQGFGVAIPRRQDLDGGREGSVKDPSTEQYREEVERLAEQHRAEVEAYRKDQERQVEILNGQESNYFAALGEVNAYLGDAEFSSEQPDSGTDYIRALDQQLMDKSKELLAEFKELVRISVDSTNLLVEEKKEG